MTPSLLNTLFVAAGVVIAFLGYLVGIRSGRRELEAYKAGYKDGQADDGGCWVKRQPSLPVLKEPS